ncbi:hypothetical protein ASPVEDRAFT_79970 [Aspergillus versicolor CBS 583.65]|uniref:Zinc/iron permease n=1 Tax=Aspergillus versicolor CBS 583.65 TaxID=1036611 RepID=A0A1L9P9U9_ASPVE|nr:uncharacterized protein ASPVEDRAFT_79970 [Aspergillus versicolor CBS 583.65]OJI98309.1 hypothetical protein ASPVEDRAFT_79970 [Aspergillus versicolor CBS 583.65]
MNCPSRTDDTLLHDEWNQNPPTLAPDLTTRQDLNGISNAREKKDEKSEKASWEGYDWKNHPQKEPIPRKVPNGGCEASLGRLAPQNIKPDIQKIKDLALWLLSVLCVSALISHDSLRKHLSPTPPPVTLIDQDYYEPVKRSSCASGGVRSDSYDLGLHVAALFIILGTSTIACAFPLLATRFTRLRIPGSFLFFVRHFGTGVLIATAFVHLLPTAFESLNNPCLSSFWTSDYPAMPGAIALAGVFFITVIEMVFSPGQSICHGGNNSSFQRHSPRIDEQNAGTQIDRPDLVADGGAQISQLPGSDLRPHLRDMGPLVGRSSSISRTMNNMSEGNEDMVRVSSAPEMQIHQEKANGTNQRDLEDHGDHFQLSPEQKQKKETMQVYLLEMGILFHSVFIGMSLSVSIGKEFVVLLIAIVFHQTFEGLALGSRIAALPWSERQLQPWFMSLAYGCTTPIGQAIGLATHTLYSPDSEVGLLVVGIMNAISAGLLVFASLVELMSEDFLSDESWRILRGKRRVCACLLVFFGAFCMSIVGAWA